MRNKIIIIIFIVLVLGAPSVIASEQENSDRAIDEIPTEDLENYLKSNSSYFSENNISIKSIIQDAFNGRLSLSLKDYLSFQIKEEREFFRQIIKTCIDVLIICLLLTLVGYFSEELKSQGVSDIVVFFSAVIIFSVILKDVNSIKNIMKSDLSKMKTVTENINALFLTAMLTFGKLSILQFFQANLNYIIGITTKFIFNFTDMASIVLISVILINNISSFMNADLLYKFLKKGTLLILSGYIIIVVINFSVQGYILYKTDNIFISTIKSLSPAAIPVVGNAVTGFFGVFIKSLLMIKDVLGITVIVFLLSAFGGSLIKIFLVFVLYKVTAVLVEPINEKVSKLIYEMADIFYVYLLCTVTPIVIVTVYYSVLLNYMNNIFG